MADRQFGTAWRLLADLPGPGLNGNVTLFDPLRQPCGTVAFSHVGQRRYWATVTPERTEVEGLWTALWDYGSGVVRQEFTVNEGQGLTLSSARMQVAQRIAPLHIGTAAASSLDTITDHSLIGGANDHLGKWFVPNADDLCAGDFRVVTGFNGSVLTLSGALSCPMSSGSRYYLFHETVQPVAVDRAIESVISGLTNAAPVIVRAEGLVPDDDGIVSLPEGWNRVSAVWLVAEDGEIVPRGPRQWECIAGRRLRVVGASPEMTVVVHGTREPRPPVWDDSVLDLNALLVLTGASSEIHHSLAGGQATDFDAHLQRANMNFQQFGALLTRLPRMPRNSTPIHG